MCITLSSPKCSFANLALARVDSLGGAGVPWVIMVHTSAFALSLREAGTCHGMQMM